ncbi:Hypothetical predicted protein [Paramuricea clavata]|uniref:Uncharacterized protein n=1 Tax=Paramuricea clavata TaxID=317549 RepID=A0A6S7II55_PARCT|nr:Hypothetical predicted protein [Paramuricea clavata]
MAIRIHLPFYKATRLILPSALMIAGLTIFLCGLVRTYHIDEVLTKNAHEEKMLQSQNEYMEWWLGLPLTTCSILAVCAVLYDRPLGFKISVLAIGTCFVILVYGVLWDAAEFSWIAYQYQAIQSLKSEGFDCWTKMHNFTYNGHAYTVQECRCRRNKEMSFGVYVPFSCELLRSQYLLHAVLGFALACALGLSLFTLFSFVLILKRISQITTALHLDEKPLSEDFDNIQGDLYVQP